MINKQTQYSLNGANQDITKSKHSQEFYYDGQHIRIIATDSQSSGSITNEKGNVLKVFFPNIVIDKFSRSIEYGGKQIFYNNNELTDEITTNLVSDTLTNFKIIGNCVTRDSLILFTTTDKGDVIWEVKDILKKDSDYSLDILYIRNLKFNENNPIQTIFNFENENIQKVYWVDGKNQLRFINIKHELIEGNSKTIDISKSNLNFVGNIEFTQPKITEFIGGGNHTSGMIQYAYNLYNLNSSQTKISPLSDLVPLDKGDNLGGGEVNEIVGVTPKIEINNIDKNYTHIKVYAIKYTSYGQIPSVSLINESEIDSNNFIYYDSGSVIDNISLTEFLFLGSNPSIPRHIESKDNRLFLSDIKTKNFLLPEELDLRAFSFPKNSSTTQVLNEVKEVRFETANGKADTINNTFNLPLKHSSINPNYNKNKYQIDSNRLGGSGKYLSYQLIPTNNSNDKTSKYFKNNEIYRIGIKFYNKLGQTSLPIWIADFKNTVNNLEGEHAKLNVNFKSTFYNWLNSYKFESEDDKPIGYKILRASREERDKTILCQGVLSPMMYQVKGNNAGKVRDWDDPNKRREFQDQSIKMPSYISRTFEVFPNDSTFSSSTTINPFINLPSKFSFLGPSKHNYFISDVNSNNIDTFSSNEIAHGDYTAHTSLHTSMMQMYSPEILFNKSLKFSTGLQLRNVGLVKNTNNGIWGQELFINSNLVKYSGKLIGTEETLGGITPWATNESLYEENNGFRNVFNTGSGANTAIPHGYILNSGGDDTYIATHWYREYNKFIEDKENRSEDIYDKPEITVEGDGEKSYGGDSKFKYKNNLRGFLVGGNEKAKLLDIQSNGAKCATIVLNNNNNISTHLRTKMEDLFKANSENSENPDSALINEIKRKDSYIYFGNIYNGNTFEQKKRTTYIEIGDYTNINKSQVSIDNPGDTFIQEFKFLRIGRTSEQNGTNTSQIISEIVSFPVETQINLKNRNDLSLRDWDNQFLPKSDDYSKYNYVYSQGSNLIKSNDVDFTFRRIEQFDSRIQSTKVKIPNESIDSWTDLLENELIDLDGKYGPINSIMTFKDKMYSFQDEAIAVIAVNPRVQIQANDGVSIELGKGNVLYDYQYLTTTSGAVNKWGITKGKRGIYYYDLLNKAVGRIPDGVDILLSDQKGFHTWFNNNYNYDLLKLDNPIKRNGVVFGADRYNNDIYMTLLQGNKTFTRCFNENVDFFIDLKKYYPSFYINKGNKLFISTNNNIYENNIGEYNKFLGKYEESFITLMVNPNANQDTIFNNIFYNSEVYLKDIDQPEKTLTHIHAYNEYQNTGKIPLELGRNKNLRRKFREWKANIPRQDRNRIRNPWIYLKLFFENKNNYKLILHDIVVSYTI